MSLIAIDIKHRSGRGLFSDAMKVAKKNPYHYAHFTFFNKSGVGFMKKKKKKKHGISEISTQEIMKLLQKILHIENDEIKFSEKVKVFYGWEICSSYVLPKIR